MRAGVCMDNVVCGSPGRHNGVITGIGDVPTDRNAEGVIHMGDDKRGFSGASVCEVNVN